MEKRKKLNQGAGGSKPDAHNWYRTMLLCVFFFSQIERNTWSYERLFTSKEHNKTCEKWDTNRLYLMLSVDIHQRRQFHYP